ERPLRADSVYALFRILCPVCRAECFRARCHVRQCWRHQSRHRLWDGVDPRRSCTGSDLLLVVPRSGGRYGSVTRRDQRGGNAMIPHPSPLAIIVFVIFVGVTLALSFYFGAKAKSAAGYFAAGGQIHWFVNGVAFAGDYLSAASFLGICGMIS